MNIFVLFEPRNIPVTTRKLCMIIMHLYSKWRYFVPSLKNAGYKHISSIVLYPLFIYFYVERDGVGGSSVLPTWP